MIAIRVAWNNEPERLVGPFGQINEALNWISRWKEAMYMNDPQARVQLTTHVITDPVQGMSWATSPTHPKSLHLDGHRPLFIDADTQPLLEKDIPK